LLTFGIVNFSCFFFSLQFFLFIASVLTVNKVSHFLLIPTALFAKHPYFRYKLLYVPFFPSIQSSPSQSRLFQAKPI